MSKLQKFFAALAVAIVITLGFIIFKQHDLLTLTKTQVESLTDTVHIYRNKLGQEVAYRQTITGDLTTTRAQLALAKSAPELQVLAKDKNVTTGIVSTTNTKIDTDVVLTKTDQDTIVAKSAGVDSGKVYENFIKIITDPWYTETITKQDDSLGVKLSVKNKYVYSIKKDGNKYTLTQTNLNPYTETQDIQSYSITPPPAKNGKWFGFGSLIGFLIAIFVFVIK